MSRRSRYALTKVSADLPAPLVQQLDGWKISIEGINRSQLISDLLKWSLDEGAIVHCILNVNTIINMKWMQTAIVNWGAVRWIHKR